MISNSNSLKSTVDLKVNLKQRARKCKILQNFALSKIENRFSFHEKSIFFKSDKKSIKYKLNAIRNAANYRIAPKARWDILRKRFCSARSDWPVVWGWSLNNHLSSVGEKLILLKKCCDFQLFSFVNRPYILVGK